MEKNLGRATHEISCGACFDVAPGKGTGGAESRSIHNSVVTHFNVDVRTFGQEREKVEGANPEEHQTDHKNPVPISVHPQGYPDQLQDHAAGSETHEPSPVDRESN
ncbi:hypothetical protein ABEG17_00310 [Pedococcus sp. KACC 23699]|uniref:Uncharacterized protein n=1 Tax=Pedococcus sp. KACC 23699 TaxID=3149228 RepID=A0AAU7JVC5_9MICO